MLQIRPLAPGELGPDAIDARILCDEAVSVRVGHSGYAVTYLPSGSSRWLCFPPTGAAAEALEGVIPGAFALGAFVDGAPVGLAAAALRPNRWCDLMDLRVDVSFRQQGIGQMLLDACARTAAESNMAGLRMLVSDTNPVMCRFAEHCGFRLEGIDRLLWAMTPAERIKPRARRACALIFYRPAETAG